MMASVRSRDTAPEMAVRRALHAAGYRYRLHRKDLPGTPDIVFGPKRIVVRVQGCFWHGHSCRKGRLPTTNVDFWARKIERNVSRDATDAERLARMGWTVLDVWECSVPQGISEVLDQLASTGRSRSPSTA